MMLLYHVSFPFGRYSHWKPSLGTFTTAPGDRCIGSCVFGVAQADPNLVFFLTNTLTLGVTLSCLPESFSCKGC